MSRGPLRLAVLLLCVAWLAAHAAAQGNQGIIISEVVHGPSQPPVGGVPIPSYIELVNVQIANPVIPPPTQIGSSAAGNATLTARVSTGVALTFTIPLGFQLGGNVQPAPAHQPPSLPVDPPVLVIASGPFPPGVLPGGITPIQSPQTLAFFSGPNAQLGAPGVPFELCFNNTATGLSDRIHLGPQVGAACSAQPFNNTLTFQPTTGRAIRWTYVDSNTDIDFDPNFGRSPGSVNPQMTHVNGFFFGTPVSPALGGAPLTVQGSLTSGNLVGPLNAQVSGIHFVNSFLNRTITNPAFDAVINAQVSMVAGFVAQPPTINAPLFLPGLVILNESLTIFATTPAGSGFLSMPSNFSTQVGTSVGPSAASTTDIRPERIFSDLISDAAPFVNGSPTAAQIDVIPPSTGGGNQWCEIIVYDYQGNQYRAKVKNWPPGGACGGPLLGLGTDGAGSFTLIDLCFNPGSSIANLFSASPAATCGGPLFPPGGLCPDTFTAFCLTPPQLGTPPYFPIADSAGLYYFQVLSPTLAPFIGTVFEGIAIEYVLPGVIVQQSPVTAIQI
jgi:hypothetical protein